MGNSVVTVGARHVKVWRVEKVQTVSPSKGPLDAANSATAVVGSPNPKTFSGRNCLLGSLLDATFTCIAPISELKAILCTSQGDVCLLDDSDKTQSLEKVAQTDFGIQCAYFDEARQLVWVAGKNQKTKAFSIDRLTSSKKYNDGLDSPDDRSSPTTCDTQHAASVLAIGCVADCIITSDTERHVRITEVEKDKGNFCVGTDTKHLPAHESAVLGICELQRKPSLHEPDFLTYSARGTVLFWRLDGTCTSRMDISLDQMQGTEVADRNELRVVVESASDEMLYSGDKDGVLRYSLETPVLRR